MIFPYKMLTTGSIYLSLIQLKAKWLYNTKRINLLKKTDPFQPSIFPFNTQSGAR